VTEKKIEYKAGQVEDYYWVECRVSLPADRDAISGEPQEFSCMAKVQVSDLIDALDLDRWTTQAFQYIWRSGRKPGEGKQKELSKAGWFLQRGVEMKNHWQASLVDVVASCIERALQRHGSQTLALGLSTFAEELRNRVPEAIQVVADAYGNELTKVPKTTPALRKEA
jgi:hypothetical protein